MTTVNTSAPSNWGQLTPESKASKAASVTLGTLSAALGALSVIGLTFAGVLYTPERFVRAFAKFFAPLGESLVKALLIIACATPKVVVGTSIGLGVAAVVAGVAFEILQRHNRKAGQVA